MLRRTRNDRTSRVRRRPPSELEDVKKSWSSLQILFIVLASLVIVGNIVIMGFFALTRVGLTEDENTMLAMTSSQINQLYADACIVLDQVGGIQNYTDTLLENKETLDALKITQIALNESVTILNETSTSQMITVIIYNSTIDNQLAVLQPKIDNTTISQLNLTLDTTPTLVSNGTVLLSNPNNRLENTTLEYLVKKFLNKTLVYVGLPGDSLNYQTLGAQNWVSLIDWDPPLFMVSNGTFSDDQVLDSQRDKISIDPQIGLREYNVGSNELKLKFDGLLVMSQNITFVETVHMSVGLL